MTEAAGRAREDASALDPDSKQTAPMTKRKSAKRRRCAVPRPSRGATGKDATEIASCPAIDGASRDSGAPGGLGGAVNGSPRGSLGGVTFDPGAPEPVKGATVMKSPDAFGASTVEAAERRRMVSAAAVTRAAAKNEDNAGAGKIRDATGAGTERLMAQKDEHKARRGRKRRADDTSCTGRAQGSGS